MSTETFYDLAKTIFENASWTSRGKVPKVKRFSEEQWHGQTNYGMLIDDSLKQPVIAANGTIIFENNRAQIYMRDTKQENLDLAEGDFKRITKENFCYEIYSWVYMNPTENTYGFRCEVKIID